MKKARINYDIAIVGWKTLKEGEVYPVSYFNSKYVYIIADKKIVRLSRRDVKSV